MLPLVLAVTFSALGPPISVPFATPKLTKEQAAAKRAQMRLDYHLGEMKTYRAEVRAGFFSAALSLFGLGTAAASILVRKRTDVVASDFLSTASRGGLVLAGIGGLLASFLGTAAMQTLYENNPPFALSWSGRLGKGLALTAAVVFVVAITAITPILLVVGAVLLTVSVPLAITQLVIAAVSEAPPPE